MSANDLSLVEHRGVLTGRLQSGEEWTKEGWWSLNKARTHVRFRRNRGRGFNRNNGGDIMIWCHVREVVNFEKVAR